MSKIMYNILNNINVGIIILNEQLEVNLWNRYMEHITKIKSQDVKNKNIYKIFPNLNKHYFGKVVNDALNNGHKMFFSAAMHKGLINNRTDLNLNISRFMENKFNYLILEFVDVTNQFIQINTLKEKVNELYKVNKELKEKEKTIKKLAYYDKLTGVANRRLFYEMAGKYLKSAERNESRVALMFIDIDKFKIINDTFGHQAGDRVLAKVAQMLKTSVRANDLVARHGGDEFLVLLPDIKSTDDYKSVISRINKSKYKSVKYNGNQIEISISIGISFYPEHGESIDKLISEADDAMYTAKKMSGQNNYFESEFSRR